MLLFSLVSHEFNLSNSRLFYSRFNRRLILFHSLNALKWSTNFERGEFSHFRCFLRSLSVFHCSDKFKLIKSTNYPNLIEIRSWNVFISFWQFCNSKPSLKWTLKLWCLVRYMEPYKRLKDSMSHNLGYFYRNLIHMMLLMMGEFSKPKLGLAIFFASILRIKKVSTLQKGSFAGFSADV